MRYDGHEGGLAERLGLHAPFRTFGDGDRDLVYDNDAAHHKPKWRRTVSSSSLLEPAEVDVEPGLDQVPDDSFSKPEARSKNHEIHGRGFSPSGAGSNSSDPPVEVTTLPEELPKPYKRRSRHKTRADRYDLKENAKRSAKKQKKDNANQKGKKRKRKEKSGNTLMHDFTASNVAQDRLTVSLLIIFYDHLRCS